MASVDDLSRIVRRVPNDYSPRSHERLLFVANGEIVEPKSGLLSWLRNQPLPEAWLVDSHPRRIRDVGGTITNEKVVFPNGDVAQVDITYSNVRPVVGHERKLVLAMREGDKPHQVLELYLSGMATDTIGAIDDCKPADWRLIKTGVQREVVRKVRDRLGLELRLDLLPAGRVGQITHDCVTWPLALLHVDEPQLFLVELSTDDDPDRLPVNLPSDLAAEELARAKVAIIRACAGFKLSHFPEDRGVRRTLRVEVNEALQPLARQVSSLKVVPAADVLPEEQRRVTRSFVVDVGERSLELGLHLLLTVGDAGQAKNFEQRIKAGFDEAITEHASAVAERYLVGKTLDILFEQEESLFEAILDEVSTWIDGVCGYRTGYRRLELKTPRPVPARRVRLTVPLALEPLAGRVIEVEVRATAELHRPDEWLRSNAPDVTSIWSDELRDVVHTVIHTQEEADAIRSKEELEGRLEELLVNLTGRDGYELLDIRLMWGSTVPIGERTIHLSVKDDFPYLESGNDRVALVVTGALRAGDDWRYAAWPGAREEGWHEDLVRRVVSEELSFRSRQDIRLSRTEIESKIKTTVEQEALERGYECHRPLVIKGLELPSAIQRLSQRIAVTVPLHRLDDVASWTGVVELSLVDENKWVLAGEPDPRECLEDWATRSLAAACRQSSLGVVDDYPDEVSELFADRLDQELKPRGYVLDGAEGSITTSNAPPPSLLVTETVTCTVGQRRVRVRATVRVELGSAAKWRESHVRELEPWLRINTHDAIQRVLLPISFAEVLQDVVRVHNGEAASVDKKIEDELKQRASEIGYGVTQVLSFPDEEARELLGSFHIGFEESFGTAWAEREVKLQVDVVGHFADFDNPEIAKLLSRGESVKKWIQGRVSQQLTVSLLDLTPNQVFFHWERERHGTRRRLAAAVAKRLGAHSVVEPEVKLTPLPPPYIEKIRDLVGKGPYPFTIELPPRLHHRRYVYDASFSVEGLDERGAGKLFSRTEPLTASVIEDQLRIPLATALGGRSDEEILSEDDDLTAFESLVHDMKKQTRDFCGEYFGIAASLVTILRRPADEEHLFEQVQRDKIDEATHVLQVNRMVRQGEVELWSKQIQDPSAHELPLRSLREARQASARGLGNVVGALGADGGTQVLGLRAPTVSRELDVDAPPSGYPSSEESCRLHVAAKLTIEHSDQDEVPTADIESEVRRTLGEVLGDVEPAAFWLRFEHPLEGRPPLSDRARSAIEAALQAEFPQHRFQVRLESPRHHWHEGLAELFEGKDFDDHNPDVELENGLARGSLRVRFAIDGPTPGAWRRLERSRPKREDLWASAWQWFDKKLSCMTRRDATGDLRGILADEFADELRRAFGLEATLVIASLDLADRERQKKTHEELDAIRAELLKIKVDSPTRQQQRDLLESREKELLQELERLADERRNH